MCSEDFANSLPEFGDLAAATSLETESFTLKIYMWTFVVTIILHIVFQMFHFQVGKVMRDFLSSVEGRKK